MLKLFVLGGSAVGQTHDCQGGEVLGRAPECAVQLNDRSVSRKHAQIVHELGTWELVDLGSRNGVFVEGKRVERVEIEDGIEVTIGELPLRFRFEHAGSNPPPSRPPQAAPPARAPAPAPPAARPGPPPAPTRPPGSRSAQEDAFVLEEDDDLDRVLVETAQRPAAKPAALTTKLHGAEDRRRELLTRGADGGGFLGGDLSQRPLWIQFLVGVALLAFAGAVAWGAWLAVISLRSS